MPGKVGRPKLYESDTERKATHRKRRNVRSVALGPCADAIDSIAEELGRPASEVIDSFLRFALMNRNWKVTGLMPRPKEKIDLSTDENGQ